MSIPYLISLELGIHELVLILLMNSSLEEKILELFFLMMIHGGFKTSLYLWKYNIPHKPLDKYISELEYSHYGDSWHAFYLIFLEIAREIE